MSQWRAEQVPLFPLRPLPHIEHHKEAMWIAPPWGVLKALTLTMKQVSRDKKKKRAQMKKHIKASEKIQQSDEEITILSDAQFKHW